MLGKDWRQEEKGTTENEMVGWHCRLNGHEFEQVWEIVKNRGAWRTAVHGVFSSLTRDWTSAPLQWKCGFLTTGLPGNSLEFYLIRDWKPWKGPWCIWVLLCQPACRILVLWPGIEPGPWQWKCWGLTTGPPMSSQEAWCFCFVFSFCFAFWEMSVSSSVSLKCVCAPVGALLPLVRSRSLIICLSSPVLISVLSLLLTP